MTQPPGGQFIDDLEMSFPETFFLQPLMASQHIISLIETDCFGREFCSLSHPMANLTDNLASIYTLLDDQTSSSGALLTIKSY